jgi:hypothetical protein
MQNVLRKSYFPKDYFLFTFFHFFLAAQGKERLDPGKSILVFAASLA